MGTTAFIMAETLGMKYSEIALAAIIPGLLYYIGVITVVHLRAKKLGLLGLASKELPNIRGVMKERGHLLIPLFILIYMLFGGLHQFMPQLGQLFQQLSWRCSEKGHA